MSRRSTRPKDRKQCQLAFVRIMIASFFVAMAVGLIPYPSTLALTGELFAESTAVVVTTTFMFVTSFAIMVGRNVRTASLSLAIFLLASHIAFSVNMPESASLELFWQNTMLVGILILVGLTRPGGSKSLHVLHKKIMPRRVRPKAARRRADVTIPADVAKPEKTIPESEEPPAPVADQVTSDAPPTFASCRKTPKAARPKPALRLIYDSHGNDTDAA